MSKKPTGLSAFAVRKPDPAPPSPAVAADESMPDPSPTAGLNKRTRAQGATVSLTVRVSRADWSRLHQLAVSEGTSIQALAMRGFSKVFEEQGLPGVSTQ